MAVEMRLASPQETEPVWKIVTPDIFAVVLDLEAAPGMILRPDEALVALDADPALHLVALYACPETLLSDPGLAVQEGWVSAMRALLDLADQAPQRVRLVDGFVAGQGADGLPKTIAPLLTGRAAPVTDPVQAALHRAAVLATPKGRHVVAEMESMDPGSGPERFDAIIAKALRSFRKIPSQTALSSGSDAARIAALEEELSACRRTIMDLEDKADVADALESRLMDQQNRTAELERRIADAARERTATDAELSDLQTRHKETARRNKELEEILARERSIHKTTEANLWERDQIIRESKARWDEQTARMHAAEAEVDRLLNSRSLRLTSGLRRLRAMILPSR